MTEPHTHGGTDAPECTTCGVYIDGERGWTDMGEPPIPHAMYIDDAVDYEPSDEDVVFPSVAHLADAEPVTTVDWAPAIALSREAVDADGPETEACGYVVDGRVVLCANQSHVPGRFAFSNDDCIAVYDAMEQGTLEGVWHSHPQGHITPSIPDWDNQPRGVDMFIVVLIGSSEHVLKYDDSDRP